LLLKKTVACLDTQVKAARLFVSGTNQPATGAQPDTGVWLQPVYNRHAIKSEVVGLSANARVPAKSLYASELQKPYCACFGTAARRVFSCAWHGYPARRRPAP
jgi:hypothetical protein